MGKLPSGYIELNYIESSGTQYIDTNYAITSSNYNKLNIVLDMEISSSNASSLWAVTGTGATNKNAIYIGSYNNTIYYGNGLKDISTGVTYDYKRRTWTLGFNNGKITVSDICDISFTPSAPTTSMNFLLFAFESSVITSHKAKLWRAKIYDNGTIVRNFIPCINPYGEIGLYDLVNSKFYSNAGTGTFIAGDFAEEIKLPSRYTKLEYIKSGGIQYIDTKFAPDKNTRVLIKASSNESGNNNVYLFGCDEGYGVNAYGVTTWTAEFENNKTSTAFTWHDGLIHKIDFNKGLLYIDEALKWSSSSTTLQTSLNMYLFADNRSGTAMPFNGKIYSCQIYDNGILIRNYIPCFDNVNNKIGLYDSVNNEFYENIGQGEFTSKGNYCVKNIKLPSDYIKLNYIESTGVQYIDTNFIPNQDSRVIIDHTMIGPADGANFGALFGTWPNPNDDSYMYLIYKEMTSCQTYFDHEIKRYAINSNGRHFLDANKNIYYLDGIQVTTAPFSSFDSVYPIYLFAYNDAGIATAPSKARIYSCKIYDSNTLKRFFVPCLKKSTGEIGLYDIVENNFHNNKGSGNFLIKENYLDYIKLPDNYIKLKYIESNGYQYIDTGLKPNENTKINILTEPISVLNFKENGVGFAPYGASTDYNNLAFECYSHDSKYSFNYGNENYSGVGTASLNNLLLISQDNNQNSVYNFCTETSSNLVYTAQTFETDYNLLLFGINRTGKFMGGSQKVYQCQIYNNNNILHNFIPCINPDNKIGMFDIVTQNFYENKGAKAFSPGPFAEEIQLPKDYIKLEYIEATGTQWIDTGFISKNTTRIECDWAYTDVSTGQYSGTYSDIGFMMFGINGKHELYYGNELKSAIAATTERFSVFIDGLHLKANIVDTDYSLTANTFTNTTSLPIFVLRGKTEMRSYCKARCYSYRIYDNGVLERNFIPCKNSNNEIGLYDTVYQTFYKNAGSGTFIAGPEAKYYKLDYIASNGKQYIDTRVIGKINTKTSIDFQILSTDLTDFFAIGSAGPNYTPKFYPVSTQYDKWSYGFNNDWQNSNIIAETGQRYFIETNLSAGVQNMKVDESIVKNSTTSTAVNTNLNMFLFSSNMNGTTATYPTAMKLYECKIYQNGDLIRNFTPVIRSDGEIGLFDSIQYAFYTNKGLESFEAGNIIENANSLNARCKIDNVWKNLVKAYVKIDEQWKEIQQLLPITKK